MRLSPHERAMLSGERGGAVRRAMEIVVTLGRIYDAQRLLPIQSVQVAGVSYRNLGEAGLEFLRDWAREGARACVSATLNPAGMDMKNWRRMGVSERFARKQMDVLEAYSSMGIQRTCTCTPYLSGNVPKFGQHVAWSESSAVSYANSVLGARTNREGGPGALAAAITGRTADYGLHLDENRRATHRVEVRCPVRRPYEFAALGYLVGREIGRGVPWFVGLELSPIDTDPIRAPDEPEARTRDVLKLMGAALASSGAVGLYHVEGVTPEACAVPDVSPKDVPTLTIESLEPAMAALRTRAPVQSIDLVAIGCPHASLDELRQVAEGLRGAHLSSDLWVTVARSVRDQAKALGLVEIIEDAGGLVIADTCVVVAPMHEIGYRSVATNSAKLAAYALPHAGLQVRFGSLERCLSAAIDGHWDTVGETPMACPGQVATTMGLVPTSEASTNMPLTLRGRVIVEGHVSGLALVSTEPIGFLGGVDPDTGLVIEREHVLEGHSVAGRILVFPFGKGSTVGSYTIYRLGKAGLAPRAIINLEAEPVVAVGALIAGVPMIDKVDICRLRTGMHVVVHGEVIRCE